MLPNKTTKISLIFIILIIIFDQISKQHAFYNLSKFNNIHKESVVSKIKILSGFLNLDLIYRENYAAAFNMMGFLPREFLNLCLLIMCSGLTFLIYRAYSKIKNSNVIISLSFICIIAGAIANILDRIKLGYVIDYIDLYMYILVFKIHWPTFNLADLFIVLAIINICINHPIQFIKREL